MLVPGQETLRVNHESHVHARVLVLGYWIVRGFVDELVEKGPELRELRRRQTIDALPFGHGSSPENSFPLRFPYLALVPRLVQIRSILDSAQIHIPVSRSA